MPFQTYQKYKPSGIDWLGEIPEGWNIFRIKDIGNVRSGDGIIANDLIDDGKYEVFGGNGFIGLTNKYNIEGENIIIGRVGAKCGNVRFVKERKFISDNALILKLKNREKSYFFSIVLETINLNRFNLSSAQPLITGTQLLNTQIPIPNKQTQTAIADYLDQHTALIDKKIELLKAKKQSYTELKQTLINEVVTKGLDKAVEMKDSGIEWIGQIPKHWEVKRLKEIGRLYNGYGFSLNDQGNDIGEIPFYKVSDINGSQKYISVANNYVSIDLCKKNSWKLIPNMSIITAKIGEALKKNHRKINTKECLIDNNCVAIVINNYDVDYYFWLFKTVDFAYFDNMGTVPSMSTNHFNSFEVVSPPKSEQIAIANHLDEKTSKIDQIIKKIDENILALQEFRKTLINDVVTGKVKVL